LDKQRIYLQSGCRIAGIDPGLQPTLERINLIKTDFVHTARQTGAGLLVRSCAIGNNHPLFRRLLNNPIERRHIIDMKRFRNDNRLLATSSVGPGIDKQDLFSSLQLLHNIRHQNPWRVMVSCPGKTGKGKR
jgi:hypothetical protein